MRTCGNGWPIGMRANPAGENIARRVAAHLQAGFIAQTTEESSRAQVGIAKHDTGHSGRRRVAKGRQLVEFTADALRVDHLSVIRSRWMSL